MSSAKRVTLLKAVRPGDNESLLADGFRARVRELADAAGSVNSLARRTGVPQSALARYLNVDKPSEPTLSNLVRLARATGVSVEWLATGEGEKCGPPGAAAARILDRELLLMVIDCVDAAHPKMPPGRKAQVILGIYDLSDRPGEKPDRAKISAMARAV